MVEGTESEAIIEGFRNELSRLWKSHAWRSAWEKRIERWPGGSLEAVHSVMRLQVSLVRQAAKTGDAAAVKRAIEQGLWIVNGGAWEVGAARPIENREAAVYGVVESATDDPLEERT